MRILRLSLVGTFALALFGGLSGIVIAQDEDPMAPATFTWEFTEYPADIYMVDLETGSQVTVDMGMRATDPRASGLLTFAQSGDPARLDKNSGVIAWSMRLLNDGGTWAGTGTTAWAIESDERTKKQKKRGTGKRPLDVNTLLWELEGEGDYDGLSRYLSTAEKWWGVIVPTDTLTTPELPPVGSAPREAAE